MEERRLPIRSKRVENPQNGRKEIIRRPYLDVVKIINFNKIRDLGRFGEEFVHYLFPHWQVMPPGNPGYDFISTQRKRGGKPRKVEVKTLSREEASDKIIRLKIRGGEWYNKLADDLLIVSTFGIFRGEAQKLRDYVKHGFSMPYFAHLKEISLGQPLLLEFDLRRLESLGVIVRQNISEKKFQWFLLNKLKEAERERKKAAGII